MSNLIYLQQQIMDAGKALAEAERLMRLHPDPALQLMAMSIRAEQEAYEEQFLSEASTEGMDFCDYRIFTSQPAARTGIRGLAVVLEEFQGMVSVVYSAISRGLPRARSGVSLAVEQATEMGFGYAYAGSLGFVLTIPKDPRLLEKTMEQTFEAIASMAETVELSELTEAAKQYGPAAIRALYRWSRAHVDAQTGASIQFREAADVKTQIVAETPKLTRLASIIEQLSEHEEVLIEKLGTLVGIDTNRRSFHATFDDEFPEIHGKLGDLIGLDAAPVVAHRHRQSFQVADQAQRVAIQRLAGGRRRHALFAAREQGGAGIAFEFHHALAGGGERNAEVRRAGGQAAGIDHGDKNAQRYQVEVRKVDHGAPLAFPFG